MSTKVTYGLDPRERRPKERGSGGEGGDERGSGGLPRSRVSECVCDKSECAGGGRRREWYTVSNCSWLSSSKRNKHRWQRAAHQQQWLADTNGGKRYPALACALGAATAALPDRPGQPHDERRFCWGAGSGGGTGNALTSAAPAAVAGLAGVRYPVRYGRHHHNQALARDPRVVEHEHIIGAVCVVSWRVESRYDRAGDYHEKM